MDENKKKNIVSEITWTPLSKYSIT